MRHAKAQSFGSDDHDRELTDRGRRDAAEAGAWASSQDLLPDHVLVSSAARTQETWREFAQAASCEVTPEISDALYAAGPESALEVLRAAPVEVRTLMFIGHNPTAGYLAQLLDDGDGDQVAFAQLSGGFPTAALAVLGHSTTWPDLGAARARLQAFHVGEG